MRHQILHQSTQNSTDTIGLCITETGLADLGAAIAEQGISRHERAVQELVADARLLGITTASIEVLGDVHSPEVARDRAFASVASDVLRTPVRPATAPAPSKVQTAESVLTGSTHAVSSPSTRFSLPNAIQEPRHMVSSTSSLSL